MIAPSPRAAGRGEGADRASAPVARMSAAKCGAPDFAPLIRATSRRAGDAAFFSVGARSSDLDKLSGRLTTCAQANERATCKSHEVEHRMSNRSQLFCLATASAVCFGTPAFAQDTVKIGELNSYKAQPAFLEPYKRGWELAARKKRWAVIYPNFEYGQSAATWFKEMLKKAQPDVEFGTEQAPPLGKVDAGAIVQAIDDAKPDAIFNVLFGADLAKLVREGTTRGTFKNRVVVSLLSGEPEYLDPLKDEAPVGWIVTGYPWDEIKTPAHTAFMTAYQKRWNDYPRLGSVVGYVTMHALAAGIAKAASTDTDTVVAALRGLKLDSPLGPL